MKQIFKSEQGLRAGWRLLIWFAIALGIQALASYAAIALFHAREHPFLDPRWLMGGDALLLVSTMIPTLLMAQIERRKLREYYIPAAGLLSGKPFWRGTAWGVAAVSLLIAMIAALGGYRITGLATHGSELVYAAWLWVLAALMIGIAEEIAFRAYILRTLADGIGFWPAAAVLSIGFGALHYFGKPFERWEDFASTALLGLFGCLTIRRTGSLAFMIGFHAAFDWAALFFYAGRNAGEFATGRLFETSWPGPQWLTGGLLGPEASRLVFLVIATLFVAFHRLYNKQQCTPAN